MKYKNVIYLILFSLTAVVASWCVPALVKKMVYDSNGYPLMYYLSLIHI